MKRSSLTIITILVCQTLSGCNTFNAWKTDQLVKAVQKGKDTCGRGNLEKFVGTPFDDLIIKGHYREEYGRMDNGSGAWELENRIYFLSVLDPRGLLPGEDLVITADLSPRRLRMYVGKDGNIEKLTCG